jgi:hypothetical protein
VTVAEQPSLARRLWRALEPYHAVTYFAPESREITAELGLKGGWMTYFGLRAAPLGAVPAEVVTATFYNFHPQRVGRAIPAAWLAASPAALLDARTRSVDAALRRLLGDAVDAPELVAAAELAGEAALAAPVAGRPLAAANAALDWPTEPHLVLWHAQTLLRESRGGGHVAALVSAGLDPCEALVAFAADGRVGAEALRGHRGWSEDEWAAAARRLTDRGLLRAGGALTEAGAAARRWVEDRTDQLAAPSWDALGPSRSERLVEAVTPLVGLIIDGGGFVPDNPMGLRPLR